MSKVHDHKTTKYDSSIDLLTKQLNSIQAKIDVLNTQKLKQDKSGGNTSALRKEIAELKSKEESHKKTLAALNKTKSNTPEAQKIEAQRKKEQFIAKVKAGAVKGLETIYQATQVAAVITSIGGPAKNLEEIKVKTESNTPSVSAPQRPEPTEDKKEEKRKEVDEELEKLWDAREIDEKKREHKKEADDDKVKKLFKERDLEIKKQMVHEKKSLSEATKNADASLLKKLSNTSEHKEQEKLSKQEVRVEIKSKLNKEFGTDAAKSYENVLKEERKKQEEAQKKFINDLNNRTIKR